MCGSTTSLTLNLSCTVWSVSIRKVIAVWIFNTGSCWSDELDHWSWCGLWMMYLFFAAHILKWSHTGVVMVVGRFRLYCVLTMFAERAGDVKGWVWAVARLEAGECEESQRIVLVRWTEGLTTGWHHQQATVSASLFRCNRNPPLRELFNLTFYPFISGLERAWEHTLLRTLPWLEGGKRRRDAVVEGVRINRVVVVPASCIVSSFLYFICVTSFVL